MSNNPAYDPTDSRYFDEKDLRAQVERVFSLCADCRMCVKYCGSFPKLFNAVDDYCVFGKYADVDTKRLKAEDVRAVVDHLGLPKVVLVGNSLGGVVALEAAALLRSAATNASEVEAGELEALAGELLALLKMPR